MNNVFLHSKLFEEVYMDLFEEVYMDLPSKSMVTEQQNQKTVQVKQIIIWFKIVPELDWIVYQIHYNLWLQTKQFQ